VKISPLIREGISLKDLSKADGERREMTNQSKEEEKEEEKRKKKRDETRQDKMKEARKWKSQNVPARF
jgi:hypothetical protein